MFCRTISYGYFKKALAYFKVLKDKAPIDRRQHLTLYFGICSLKERDFEKLDAALESLRRAKAKKPSIDTVGKKITKSMNRNDGRGEQFTTEENEADPYIPTSLWIPNWLGE